MTTFFYSYNVWLDQNDSYSLSSISSITLNLSLGLTLELLEALESGASMHYMLPIYSPVLYPCCVRSTLRELL